MPTALPRFWSVALVVTAFLAAPLAAGESPKPDAVLPAGVSGYYPQLFGIVERLGQGDIDGATTILEQEMPPLPKQPEELFPVDWRAGWRTEFRFFHGSTLAFESIDLVGVRPVSSQACDLIFVAHGNKGPVIFDFGVFRYQSEWKLNSMAYQLGWKNVIDGLAAGDYTRLPEPIHHELKAASLATKPRATDKK